MAARNLSFWVVSRWCPHPSIGHPYRDSGPAPASCFPETASAGSPPLFSFLLFFWYYVWFRWVAPQSGRVYSQFRHFRLDWSISGTFFANSTFILRISFSEQSASWYWYHSWWPAWLSGATSKIAKCYCHYSPSYSSQFQSNSAVKHSPRPILSISSPKATPSSPPH